MFQGLRDEEAAKRLELNGRNELYKEPPEPVWQIFLAQFNDLLVILLIISSIVSAALGYGKLMMYLCSTNMVRNGCSVMMVRMNDCLLVVVKSQRVSQLW